MEERSDVAISSFIHIPFSYSQDNHTKNIDILTVAKRHLY